MIVNVVFFIKRNFNEHFKGHPFFFALLFSFFPSRVYCIVLFHTGFCSAAFNLNEHFKVHTLFKGLVINLIE